MSSWTRGVPDESRAADGDPRGPPRGDTGRPRRGGPGPLRPSARCRRRRANGVRLRPDQVRAGVNRPVGHPVTARRRRVDPGRSHRRRQRPAAAAVGRVPTRPPRHGAVRSARTARAVAARRGGGRCDRRARASAGGRSCRCSPGARRGLLRPLVAVGRPGGAAGCGGPRRRTRRPDSGRAARRPDDPRAHAATGTGRAGARVSSPPARLPSPASRSWTPTARTPPSRRSAGRRTRSGTPRWAATRRWHREKPCRS